MVDIRACPSLGYYIIYRYIDMYRSIYMICNKNTDNKITLTSEFGCYWYYNLTSKHTPVWVGGRGGAMQGNKPCLGNGEISLWPLNW